LPFLQKDFPVGKPVQTLATGGVVQLIVKMAVHDMGSGGIGGLVLTRQGNEVDRETGIAIVDGYGTDAAHGLTSCEFQLYYRRSVPC
jgi:hypothetical protein